MRIIQLLISESGIRIGARKPPHQNDEFFTLWRPVRHFGDLITSGKFGLKHHIQGLIVENIIQRSFTYFRDFCASGWAA